MDDFSAAKDIDKNEATGLDIRLLPENLVELVGLLPSTTAPDEESENGVDNALNWSKDFIRPDVLKLTHRTPTYENFKLCGRLLAQARSCIYYMKHQPNDQQSDLYKAKTKDLIICLSKAARMSSLKWFRVHIYSHRVVHDTVREWLTMALSGSCRDTTRVYDCLVITWRHFMLASTGAQDLNEQAEIIAIALKFLDACIQVEEASNASDGSLYLLKACYLQTGEHTDADVVLLSKRALELNEQVNFEAHYLIGSAYGQSQQQRHAAIPHFERLLNLAPTGYWNTHLTAITLSWMLVEKYIHEGGLDTREFLIIAEHFPQYPEEALRYYKHGVAVGCLHGML
ncbi:hypothetical protein MPSEU_000361200 [Mayamaea pseudoterrestris]|nr:hypothetical protein MPSEU_000361200 [Mayamaea pseudoterrestris]